MAKSAFGEVLRYLHKCALQGACDLTDRELLERFHSHRDEDAFTFLVRRHGPMVYGVCRRLLRGSQEAEDAFQATFLVLIRLTSSIRRWESLGSWLYRVAQRIALRARAQTAARRNREREASTMEPQRDDLTWQELRLALDEEIGKLSEKYPCLHRSMLPRGQDPRSGGPRTRLPQDIAIQAPCQGTRATQT